MAIRLRILKDIENGDVYVAEIFHSLIEDEEILYLRPAKMLDEDHAESFIKTVLEE